MTSRAAVLTTMISALRCGCHRDAPEETETETPVSVAIETARTGSIPRPAALPLPR